MHREGYSHSGFETLVRCILCMLEYIAEDCQFFLYIYILPVLKAKSISCATGFGVANIQLRQNH